MRKSDINAIKRHIEHEKKEDKKLQEKAESYGGLFLIIFLLVVGLLI